MPRLLAALRGDPALDGTEQAAMRQLTGWDDAMSADSAPAAIWYSFWSDYLSAVFQPWWKAARVPVAKDPGALALTPGQQECLDEDLEAWTLAAPGNPAFTPPGGTPRTAAQVMRSAFGTAVAQLRVEVVRVTDWRSQLKRYEPQVLIGAGVAGFVLGGGIAAIGALTFGRRRRKQQKLLGR